MRTVCTIYFLVLFSGLSIAQENTTKLLAQAENTIYSDPHEAVRIAEFVSNKSQNKNELIEAAYILIRSYYIEGSYGKALKVGFKFSEEEFQNKDDTHLRINVILTRILRELELNALAEKYMEKAIQASQKSKNDNTISWFKGKTIQYNIGANSEANTAQYLKQLERAKNEFKKIPSISHSFQIGSIDLEIARIHIRELQLDSVPYYLQSVYTESKKVKPGNYLEMKYLLEYGNYLYLKKEHQAAIDSLRAAQQIAEKFTNITEQFTISEAISNNYLALGDIPNFNLQNVKTQLLNNTKNDLENDALNIAFNFINDDDARKLAKAESFFKSNILIFGGGLLLIVVLWAGFAFRYRIKMKQYQRILDYFEKKQKPEPTLPPKGKVVKQTTVPKEMEEIILEKLNDFENTTNFTNQDTSLSRLALEMDTNTKYLSEVVNFHKGKNFNLYINELRVNYIIDKLKKDPSYLQYKISYLAEDSGFSSHSVFATVFKQVTGISPTSFITILRTEKETSDAKLIKNGH